MRSRLRRLIGVGAAGLLWISAGAPLLACPVCFRFESGPVTDGVRLAVVVLMGVTTAVLAGFAVFAVRFVRRARALEGDAP